MPEIKIKVRDKCAEGEGVVICNNSDYTVVWDLDGEWEPYSARTMRVNLADGTYQDVVFTGDNAALPVLTASGWVSVGLYAGDLHTSRAARLLALSSVLTPGGSPAAPAEDVYAQIMAKLNELSTVSPEDIAKAVADYLAAHPIEETDPTVPEWAKAKTKPTYSAAEVGAIAQSDLQAATDAALAQAKSSGEFDGAAGPRGPAGANGKSAYSYAVEGGYTGTEAEFAAKLAAEKLPNPNALTFTGAVSGSYDGSEPLTVNIPAGGGGGGSSDKWELINTITVSDDATTNVTFTQDSAGNPFALKKLYLKISGITGGSTYPIIRLNGLSWKQQFGGAVTGAAANMTMSVLFELLGNGIYIWEWANPHYRDIRRTGEITINNQTQSLIETINSVMWLWGSNSAITNGSVFTLYGVRA